MKYEEMEKEALALRLKSEKIMKKAQTMKFTIDEIVFSVSEITGVSVKQLKSKSRKREYVVPRQFAMYKIKKAFNSMTWKSISGIFNRHHTTAIYAFHEVESKLSVNDEYIKFLFDSYKNLHN